MRAMVLEAGSHLLRLTEKPIPEPGPGEVQLRIRACALCRTDLHIVDGDLTAAKRHLTPGHEVIGEITKLGAEVDQFQLGQRIGVPWLGWTCGDCAYCRAGQENLCPKARFTGYTIDGGFGEWMVADARYCFAIPDGYADAEAAPLLCAGLIGYRAYLMIGGARKIGFYGFGAAAHILAQIALADGREVSAFTRSGDTEAQVLAQHLGAHWVGSSEEQPPEELDAAIIFAPVGALVPLALAAIRPGGIVVCAGIHMSNIPSFPYGLLWGERVLRSVANLTRADGDAFFRRLSTIRIRPQTTAYPLAAANDALAALRRGDIQGAAVILPQQ